MEADVLSWSIAQFQAYLMILMRVAFILFMLPLLGSKNIPVQVKVGLALTVSLVLFPVAKAKMDFFPAEPTQFVLYLVLEAVVGFLLGLSVRLVFAGIQLAGEFAGFKMGLGMAQMVDPQSGHNSTVISELYYLLALLVFISGNGHHWFFWALLRSFQLIPPGGVLLGEGLFNYFIALSGKMFVVALSISAPVIAILILAQVAMGVVARTVPQINILITSFPLTISLGFIFIGLSLDLFVPYTRDLFDRLGRELVGILIPLMAR